MKTKSAAYEAIAAAAKAAGLPRSFPGDLTVHDRAAIARNGEAAPFLWYLYEAGTVMVRPDVPPPHRHSTTTAKFVSEIPRTVGDGRWFFWDGVGLRQLAPGASQAVEIAERFAEERRAGVSP